jgi:hypothetical protein
LIADGSSSEVPVHARISSDDKNIHNLILREIHFVTGVARRDWTAVRKTRQIATWGDHLQGNMTVARFHLACR